MNGYSRSVNSTGVVSCFVATEPRYLLDANICIYLLEGRSSGLRARVEQSGVGELVTSSIACGEVMIGAFRQDALDQTIRFFVTVPVIPFDESAARVYARLPFRRGSFDRLVAAHALSLGLTLVTNNERDFADIPGLRIENWTS